MSHVTRLVLVALALAVVGCAGPRTHDTGVDPLLFQEVYIPVGAMDTPIESYIVSPYYPENRVKVRLLPPGSTADPNAMETGADGKPVKVREIVVPSQETKKHETSVPCPICGKPIKVRVRRPKVKKTAADKDW